MTTPRTPEPNPDDKPKIVKQQIDPVLMEALEDLLYRAAKEFFTLAVKEGKTDLPEVMQIQCAAIAALEVSWVLTYQVSDNQKAEALQCMSTNLNTITAEYK